MEFELTEVDHKGQQKVIYYSFFAAVLLSGILWLLNLKTESVVLIPMGLFFVVLIFFVFFNSSRFCQNVKVNIDDSMVFKIKSQSGITILNNIGKWNWGIVHRRPYSYVKFINEKDKDFIFYFKDNQASNDFLEYLQLAIKKYNQENEIGIINLEKEFYQSKKSSFIFISLYLLNFIFLILLFITYPDTKFAVWLGISMIFTVFYGVIQHVGKNREV